MKNTVDVYFGATEETENQIQEADERKTVLLFRD